MARTYEFKQLSTPESSLPTLRAIGNIAAGSDTQIDSVLVVGAWPLLAKLLVYSKMKIVEEAAWTASNIAAGNTIQIQALITNNVVRLLVDVLGKGDFKCRKEAAWAITNITLGNKSMAILEQYFSTDVRFFFWLVFSFILMINTTVLIQSVCADNLTILLRFSNIIFVLQPHSLLRLIVFGLFFILTGG